MLRLQRRVRLPLDYGDLLSPKLKDSWAKEDGPKVLRQIKIRFCDALDYHSCLLADKSPNYDYRVAKSRAKGAERLKVQIKASIFVSFDPISIMGVLSTFQLACDTNRIHERAAMQLLPFFMKKPDAAALNF